MNCDVLQPMQRLSCVGSVTVQPVAIAWPKKDKRRASSTLYCAFAVVSARPCRYCTMQLAYIAGFCHALYRDLIRAGSAPNATFPGARGSQCPELPRHAIALYLRPASESLLPMPKRDEASRYRGGQH